MQHLSLQQEQSISRTNGSPPLTETKWWYQGPDGKPHGPFSAREMSAWGEHFESLPVRNQKDDVFHSVREWKVMMGGKNPFGSDLVPAFDQIAQGGLFPKPVASPNDVSSCTTSHTPDSVESEIVSPHATTVQIVEVAGGDIRLENVVDEVFKVIWQGQPFSQPSVVPIDCTHSTASHTPDSTEPEIVSSHVTPIKIDEVAGSGDYIRLKNESDADFKVPGWTLKAMSEGKEPTMFRFNTKTLIPANSTVTVYSKITGAKNQKPTAYVMKKNWPGGKHSMVILSNKDEEIMASMTTVTRGAFGGSEKEVEEPPRKRMSHGNSTIDY